MRTYQTLTLIGSILGILIAFGVYATLGVLNITMNVFENMTGQETQSNPSAKRQADIQYVSTGVGVSIFVLIVALVLAFAIKQRTKIVGISLIIIAVVTFIAIGLFGIIPFALLLPAGISALRYKRELTKPTSD
jgi:Protein of unknown function (DUF4064)